MPKLTRLISTALAALLLLTLTGCHYDYGYGYGYHTSVYSVGYDYDCTPRYHNTWDIDLHALHYNYIPPCDTGRYRVDHSYGYPHSHSHPPRKHRR